MTNKTKKAIAFDKHEAFVETGLRTAIIRLDEAVRVADLAITHAKGTDLDLERWGHDLTVALGRAKEIYHARFPDNAIP